MNGEWNLEDAHHEYDECGAFAAAFHYNFSSL